MQTTPMFLFIFYPLAVQLCNILCMFIVKKTTVQNIPSYKNIFLGKACLENSAAL